MKSRLMGFLAGIGVIGSLCLAPSSAEAILASVKSTGMAATAISYPLDSLCIAYNPAGIVWVDDRIDQELGWLHNTARLKVSGNLQPTLNDSYTAMRTKDFYFAGGGAVKGYSFECFEVAVGLAVYNRNFQKVTYNRVLPIFGTSHPGLEFVNETVAPAIAIRLFDVHSFGIAFNWQIERLKVNGLQNFDNAQASSHPGRVTNRGYSYAHGFAPTFGYRLNLCDRFAFGFTYQPRTHMSKFKKYEGFAIDGRIDVPEKWGFGVSFDPWCCTTVAFDAELVKWSGVRSLHRDLVLPEFVPPATIIHKLGDKDGAGFGFKDQWYYRAGIEFRWTEDLTFRAGYRYAKAPPRRSQTAVNILTQDCVESFLTLGATWNVTCASEFSILYAYGFEHKVKGKNSIPPQFGGGEADLKEQKYALAIALGYKF